jgi:hypothetical protein
MITDLICPSCLSVGFKFWLDNLKVLNILYNIEQKPVYGIGENFENQKLTEFQFKIYN